MTHLFKIAFAIAALAALLAGQPPQIPGAKGDQQRHYYFPEAGKEVPFRLYVPSRFDGKTKLPMMVCLHGAGGTQDTLMDWGHGILQDLAEKHGYIVVTPLGYAPGGSYGQHYDIGIPMGARAGGNMSDAERKKTDELSEKDVLNVTELVAKEYAVDRSRIYLMGHSRGALGAWYLGNKYRQLWAGLAPVAGGFLDTDYPFEHLRGIPVIVSQGGADTVALPERARKQVAAMEKIGLHPRYVEVAGATHGSIVDAALSGIFDFFDENHGK
jgi:predicted peptidase